jgi:two-component system nitrogen regulation response regulator GlnG
MSNDKKFTNGVEECFSNAIERHLEKYFSLHNGDSIPPGLYDRILHEMERSVFEITLKYANGNQLKASKILGINRSTLRKKMLKLCSKEG